MCFVVRDIDIFKFAGGDIPGSLANVGDAIRDAF
jgi:hypothetical protein